MENNPLIAEFGERMRNERKRLGLSQEILAELVGVRQQTVLQYEKGKTSPTLQFLYSLHNQGFNLNFLFFGQEVKALPREYSAPAIRYVANAVPEIEKEIPGGALTNETRLRMTLALLEQYETQPLSLNLTPENA